MGRLLLLPPFFVGYFQVHSLDPSSMLLPNWPIACGVPIEVVLGYRYLSVISPGIYISTYPSGGGKIQKLNFWYVMVVLIFFWKFSKWGHLYDWQFFHENCWFCDVSEITGTSNSLIPIFFPQKTGTLWFFAYENFKEPEFQLFKNKTILQH